MRRQGYRGLALLYPVGTNLGYGKWLFNFKHLRRLQQLAFITLLAVLGTAASGVAGTATATGPVTILAFGDSLTAGYGLGPGESFPEQLQKRLRAEGVDAVVQNAGVSGDTSAGGLSRIDWVLQGPVDLVILELGANDGLRGIDPDVTAANLSKLLEKLQQKNIPVLLTGMRAPPNLGADYAGAFDALFPRLAEKHGVAFYPFFLDGVAAVPQLNQPDGIHPNAAGVETIVDRITPTVLPLLVEQ